MSKNILIIDDDTVFSKILADALEVEGCSVRTAENGKVGLEEIAREEPDLVVLDMLMPLVSGLGVLKNMYEREEPLTVPVLVSSNLDSMEEVSAALALGAKGYVVKSEQDMQSIVGTILQTANA